MPFIHEDFLLQTRTARRLFHEIARDQPILDYHNHLPPRDIAEDRRFNNLFEIWLEGDHYKWRAMRANGVEERFCTGSAAPYEKFLAWAQTVPQTLRNPLYHWTHLELQRHFGIDEVLNQDTARQIYDECSAKLQTPAYSVRSLLRKMNVRLICTTDDPVDSLQYHTRCKVDGFEVTILPAFRPDNAIDASEPSKIAGYIKKLEEVSNVNISSFDDFLSALRHRHDYFASAGCSVSDHGLEEMYADDFTDSEIDGIFTKILAGKVLNANEHRMFKSATLLHFAEWDWEKGWVQQFHLGALRNK